MPGISFCARDLVLCPGSRLPINSFYRVFTSFNLLTTHYTLAYSLLFSTDRTVHSLNGSLHTTYFKSAEPHPHLYYFPEHLILVPMTSSADKLALHHHNL